MPDDCSLNRNMQHWVTGIKLLCLAVILHSYSITYGFVLRKERFGECLKLHTRLHSVDGRWKKEWMKNEWINKLMKNEWINGLSMKLWWNGTDRRKSKGSDKILFQFRFIHHKSPINSPGNELGASLWVFGVYPFLVYIVRIRDS
jgi:hypothetical protein